MKLNTKKTERECECTCHTNWKAGIHGKYACPGCQPTEKPMKPNPIQI